jgi:hypothetical protein
VVRVHLLHGPNHSTYKTYSFHISRRLCSNNNSCKSDTICIGSVYSSPKMSATATVTAASMSPRLQTLHHHCLPPEIGQSHWTLGSLRQPPTLQSNNTATGEAINHCKCCCICRLPIVMMAKRTRPHDSVRSRELLHPASLHAMREYTLPTGQRCRGGVVRSRHY